MHFLSAHRRNEVPCICNGAIGHAQGSDLDRHAKQWRLFADCFNNVGYALDLASPLFPRAFLLLACLGGLARSITGGTHLLPCMPVF